jgi:HEAT repeat protein
MGIFAANTAVQHHNRPTLTHEVWSIARQGYLPARVFGYAFALFAWIRHESSPPWAAYLGSDAADAFGKGLKYLSKSTDCIFDRETVDRAPPTRSEHELLSSLDDASESIQLAALRELREHATASDYVVDSIARLLRHENPILCCEAAQALGAIKLVTDPVINGLMTNLSNDDAVVQANSVAALGELCPSLEFCGPYETSVRDELERLIDHSNPNVVLATIGTMAAYKTAFSEAAPKVWKVLLQAVFDCNYVNFDYLVAMLTAIVPDREAFLTQQLSAEDDDVRHQVMDAVRHADASEAE